MKLSDLKIGDICKQRDGTLCIVLSNNLSLNGLGLCSRGVCEGYLSAYNDDLTYSNRDMSRRDIIAIYQASEPNMGSAYALTQASFEEGDCSSYRYIEWTWQGNKDIVKEMTVSEIEELVGSKVKIVKERR